MEKNLILKLFGMSLIAEICKIEAENSFAYDKDTEINYKLSPESFKNIKSSGPIIYFPKKKKEEIIEKIDSCFGIINENSDVDFIRIQEHLLDILYILKQYK